MYTDAVIIIITLSATSVFSSVIHDNEKELLASNISCETCSIMYYNYLDHAGPFMVTSMNGPAYILLQQCMALSHKHL